MRTIMNYLLEQVVIDRFDDTVTMETISVCYSFDSAIQPYLNDLNRIEKL